MRQIDVRLLIAFNTQTDMFICPWDRQNIVSFVAGYQYGTGHECRFTEVLSQHLVRKYRIKPLAQGWPHQIAQLAERLSLKWIEMYLLVSSEVLSHAMNTFEPDSKQK